MTTHLPENERALLMLVAEGDETAFSQVFHDYYPRLLHFLKRFDQNPDEVDEAVQETFIKVWLSRDQLPRIENFRAWIFTIASREAIALIRKNLLKERTSQTFSMNRSGLDLETPAELTHAGEVKRLVAEAIADMPPARRRIFLMSREEGLKPAEIASRLNLSVSTVKNSLVKALQDIRQFLQEQGHIFLPLFFIDFFFSAIVRSGTPLFY